MSLKQFKSSIHKRFNQSYIYDCNKKIDFDKLKKGSIIVANDTSIVSVLALKTYTQDISLTVLDDFDERVAGLESLLKKSGINYAEDISFWDHDGILLVNQKFISQVEQSESRFLLSICGPELPYFSDRKNLDRQVFFDIAKLESLRTLNEELENLSVRAWEKYLTLLKSPTEIWFRQMLNAGNNNVVSDTTGVTLNGYKFVTASLLMAKQLQKLTQYQDNVGICLPTSAGGYLAILSLMISAKAIVNLNYTASEEALRHAISNAEIKTIITSKAFVEKLANKGFMVEGIFNMCEIVYLEDVKAKISKVDSILTFMQVKYLPANHLVKNISRRLI